MSHLPGQSSSQDVTPPKKEDGGVLTTLLHSYFESRDRDDLVTFFELLYDEKFASKLALQVERQGPASEITVKEVIDDALARFLEDLVKEKRRKAPKSARRHLNWILRQRFLDRRRLSQERLQFEDVEAHREEIVDPQMPEPASEALAKESEAEVDRRLETAISALSPKDAQIIRMRLAGRQYPEIAKELGIPEAQIWVYGSRAVERLLGRLVATAPTMAIRLRELKERGEREKEIPWPTRSEIEAYLPRITERVRDVVIRIHFKGEPRESVAREYGEAATEVILKRGYDLLAAKFKVDFPEAFLRAES
jgi:RNA polymerase sigma factor (sigma-70 family)